MKYQPGATGVHSRGEDAWAERSGVCQDFAHITVGALRSLGVPARYVSGYLVPKRDSAVGETSKGESHAWVEFWDDGWIACDPTNGAEVGPDHVVVARGRDGERRRARPRENAARDPARSFDDRVAKPRRVARWLPALRDRSGAVA